MADDLPTTIIQAAGQAATVRVGIVTSVNPLEISLNGTQLNMDAVGVIGGNAGFTVGGPVILLGQSVQGGSTSGASWVALGKPIPAPTFFNVAAVRVALTAQSFNSGAVTPIPWAQATYDTHGFWDAAAPSQIVIPLDGIYAVTLVTPWPVSGTGVRYCDVDQNGTLRARHRHPAISGDNCELGLATEFECTAGDIIIFNAFQTSGGPLIMNNAVGTVRYVGSVS